MRYLSTSGFSSGFDWTKPLTAQASAPTSSEPSIAAVTAARSAGGAPAYVALSVTSGAYDDCSSAAEATAPPPWL